MKSLLAGLVLLLAAEAGDEGGVELEALRYNSVERTRGGITALEKGDVGAAVERFDTARRLDDTNPITYFNAGTARLIAGQQGATAQLQETVEVAPEHLQPSAHYNLGNARLAEGNPVAAVDAYKQVLRLDPAHMDAKFNLEVAQRLLEQEQEQEQQSQDSPEGEPSEQPQDQEPEPQPGEDPEEKPGEQPEDQPGSGNEEEEQQSPLPDFEDQEDMTAEQAAAILEAVENLEREQRRQQAAERARKRAKSGKDW